MENRMEVPQKAKKRSTVRSSSPTSGHISRQDCCPKRYLNPNVHCSTVYNSQGVKAASVPTDRGTDEGDVVHGCDGVLLSPDGCSTPLAATWAGLEIIRSEASQTEKHKCHMVPLLRRTENMIQRNLFIKHILTYGHRKLMAT